MKKVVFSVFLFGLLLALTSVTAFAATEKYQMHETYAYGASNFPENNCVSTHIGYLVQDGWYRDNSGKVSLSSASINFTRYDFCQGIPLLNANGSVPVSEQTFKIQGNLASATLNTTVPMTDSLTGNTFNLAVNLTWAGVGPQERTHTNDHSTYDNMKFNFLGVSVIQNATISGSISRDGTNLVAGQPGGGAIGRAIDAQIIINH